MTGSLRCVIDTNICIKLFMIDALTPKANQLFEHLNNPSTEIFIPDFLYLECSNVFCKYVRAKLYTVQQVQEYLTALKVFNFQVISTNDLVEEAFQIALEYGIKAYDGCYVALSKQVDAPLLTLDQRLINSLSRSSFRIQLFTDFIIPPLEIG
ncbi:type II toxin-antitoxin system VapC family toxin [Pannus brasiliensis CCIBt3594]|uniref:Type II toxin-antitoxin system VapC family toxin n=1 Tax=Pannus brasiliensis CCIBt3594 TaxID=1427578 RepID=A0AAW9QS45_9CHRO